MTAEVSRQLGGENVIKAELDGEVEERDARERDLVHGHGAHGVEEDLESAEESFAEDGVEEEGFQGGGEVGIEAVDAKGFVVGEMVWLYTC